MKYRNYILTFFTICLLALTYQPTTAQKSDEDKKLVQFSGVIMSSDSLMALPYVNIIVKNTYRGTMSDYRGFFSFVAHPGDTILFSSVGYTREKYVIPDTLSKEKYSVIQLMTRDTVNLPETVVYPWPSKSQFKEAFLNMEIPDDDLERARKNLEREKLQALGERLPKDANETQDLHLRQQAKKFYYSGQYPPLGIFNPVAWGEFIDAWKKGKFKSE